jgi:hypothetical protein
MPVAIRLDRAWTDDDLDDLVKYNNDLAKRSFWPIAKSSIRRCSRVGSNPAGR